MREIKFRAWAVINCKGEFCAAFWNEVIAECEKEEIDENWGNKKAKVVLCEIKILNPKPIK